ncbi:Glyoxalase superfamily enzyme, possibly 3-demethylubiquinone-9 3-methyltransferase [Kytococcus aerolatus]|uniref:Glyoxalase superfamily enzyme, possibly 3-demethylubiquinone-9 3-methyltransferase n=1 Tax=Kytococcus aerolatus TaxID=592308 RepID=A0A212TEG4_9MICO|nr:VOC family protein [Kytococcus aerolatus]SNC64221.1 Glyoxalase superfamily enzyme, possibly 3-demethylubiquinone-9 3-methyltransferase [Kytococcus aerolatus]
MSDTPDPTAPDPARPTPAATPFLTFQPSKGQSAREAMELYAGLFDGEVVSVQEYPEGTPGAGTVMVGELRIAGLTVRCSDTFIDHAWDMTPALSIWVECTSDAEQDRLFTGLGEGGRVFMPIDDYGFGRFGWVGDRFGVTWQLARSGA